MYSALIVVKTCLLHDGYFTTGMFVFTHSLGPTRSRYSLGQLKTEIVENESRFENRALRNDILPSFFQGFRCALKGVGYFTPPRSEY